MTPKEKAKELVSTYRKEILRGKYRVDGFVVEELAEECALIAVDEMLNNAGFIWGGRDTETGLSARDEYRKYWNEVKTEIEAL